MFYARKQRKPPTEIWAFDAVTESLSKIKFWKKKKKSTKLRQSLYLQIYDPKVMYYCFDNKNVF
jgi:hypothetical protein